MRTFSVYTSFEGISESNGQEQGLPSVCLQFFVLFAGGYHLDKRLVSWFFSTQCGWRGARCTGHWADGRLLTSAGARRSVVGTRRCSLGGWGVACLPAWTSGVGQTKRKARGRSEASRSGSSEASISRHRSARDDRRLVPNPRPTRGPRCCAVSLGPNSRWLFAHLRPATECHRTLLQPEADGRGQGFLYDPNFIITFIYNLYNFYLYLYYLVS